MNYLRSITLTGALVASAALAVAQDDPPIPPTPAAAPTAPVAPRAARAYAAQAAPVAPAAPTPAPRAMAAPAPAAPPDGQFDIDQDQVREMAQQAREMAAQAREDARGQDRELGQQDRELAQQAREQAREIEQQAREMAREAARNLNFDLDIGPIRLGAPVAAQIRAAVQGAVPPMPPMPAAQPFGIKQRGNDNSLYNRGLSALDEHHYDQALDAFSEVVSRGGPKADGAIYWKAYTLNKLGRRDEAAAALTQLRTSYASSRWLEDAKSLDLEIKQASGKAVSPESESDDDLKLMALNGLSQSDPDRTYPLIEKILKGPASPKLKKKAIFVLASNSSPRAQQLLEQIARGNGNPDLQLTAISYMVQNKNQPNRTQVLMEIYSSSSDLAVKREILNAFRNNRDYDHLLQIAKSEKGSGDLRQTAIAGLGDKSGNAELWQLFQSETTAEGKIQILEAMYNNGSADRLTEVARTDKDPKVRMAAIRVLGSYRMPNNEQTMTSLYTAEQDAQVKRAIINNFASTRNAKALVDVFHKETNIELKKDILTRLQNMHTAEANELFLEILK